MKILYCLLGTFNSSGMERVVIAKANALTRLGHEVIIATTEQHGRADFYALGDGVRRVDSDVMYSDSLDLGVVRKFFVRRGKMAHHREFLKGLIEAELPDVVISTVGNEVGFLPDIAGDAATVAEIHFSRFYRLQLGRRGIWKLIDRFLTAMDKSSLRRYDRFVVLTRADAANWGDMPNLVVIPNFTEHFAERGASLRSGRTIAVGRLERQKDYPAMLRVWKRVTDGLPDSVLEIYGEGSQRAFIENLIHELGLEGNVRLRGVVEDMDSVYREASLLLHTAAYEGMPMVLIEAMGAGVPVVSFDCPCGPSDIIKDGQTGFLVEHRNEEELARAAIRVLSDEKLRHRLGDASFTEARRYAPERVVAMWVRELEELTAGR